MPDDYHDGDTVQCFFIINKNKRLIDRLIELSINFPDTLQLINENIESIHIIEFVTSEFVNIVIFENVLTNNDLDRINNYDNINIFDNNYDISQLYNNLYDVRYN